MVGHIGVVQGLDLLILAYGVTLVASQALLPSPIALRGSIHAVQRSSAHPLIVVRKAAGGSQADAVNAGIVVADMPLLCFVDADSVIEHEALLHLAEPFVRSPGRTVAVGGSVRIVNGSDVRNSEVVRGRAPKNLVARIQAVEYLRAFMCARAGWRYTDRRDILSLVAAIVVEPIVYRPMTLVWRVQGSMHALRGTRSEWGSISRAGIGATVAVATG